jgi:hypothetical protein
LALKQRTTTPTGMKVLIAPDEGTVKEPEVVVGPMDL